jgi:hypothetical protein
MSSWSTPCSCALWVPLQSCLARFTIIFTECAANPAKFALSYLRIDVYLTSHFPQLFIRYDPGPPYPADTCDTFKIVLHIFGEKIVRYYSITNTEVDFSDISQTLFCREFFHFHCLTAFIYRLSEQNTFCRNRFPFDRNGFSA